MFLWIGKGGGRRFSLSGSSELLNCPVRICWTLELLQWIERIMQPLGWFAQPVTWLHPERAPSRGTEGEMAKEQELPFVCTFPLCCSFLLVNYCSCASTVLGLVSKLRHKKRDCERTGTRETGTVYTELLVGNWSLGLDQFWIYVCSHQCASWGYGSATVWTDLSQFDRVLQPPTYHSVLTLFWELTSWKETLNKLFFFPGGLIYWTSSSHGQRKSKVDVKLGG